MAGLVIRGLDIDDEAPAEAGAQARLQHGHVPRGLIGGDDDLPAGVAQVVEHVEELELRRFLAADELDIVDQQHVEAAVLFAQGGPVLFLDGRDDVVREVLARGVEDAVFGMLAVDIVADRVHEVRFAEADAAVYEQRVIRRGRIFRDGKGGGIREAVRFAANEGVEGILRDQRRAALADGLRPRELVLLRRGSEADGKLLPGRAADRLFDHRAVEPVHRVAVHVVLRLQYENPALPDAERDEGDDPAVKADVRHLRLQKPERV